MEVEGEEEEEEELCWVSLTEQAFRFGSKFSTPQLPTPLKLLETSPDARGLVGCFASVRLHCGSR